MTIFSVQESENLQNELRNKMSGQYEVLLDYPTVYIHAWKDGGLWNFYVGETYDIVRRTKEHYAIKEELEGENGRWQSQMKSHLQQANEQDGPILYVFGDQEMNRSLTLDLEDALISALDNNQQINLHNGRHNSQGSYQNCDKFAGFFQSIWKTLQTDFLTFALTITSC